MKDEGVDLNNITIITKKEKTSNDAVAPKVNSSRPYKPILPVRSSSSDEIQTAPTQDDRDVVAVEPSTSNASTSNGDAAAAAASSAAMIASKQAIAALNGMGINMTSTQMAESLFFFLEFFQ
ncbi:hypothetical protein OSTOST_18698 [Ostertagia ostertagi]